MSLRAATVVSLAVLAAGTLACKGDQGPPGQAASGYTSSVVAPNAQNLLATLTAARVLNGNQLQVDYTLTDGAGNPASMTNVTSFFTAAYLGTDSESGLPVWQSLVFAPASGAQPPVPTYESNTAGTIHGATTDLGGGKFQYTFTTPLPAGTNQGATFRIGSWMRRPTAGVITPSSVADYDVTNAVLDFVPSGGTPQPRDLVSTQACNQCHGILGAHGGYRRDVRICATCHTTQLVNQATIDTGLGTAPNHLDLQRLIHRIHRGANLPTIVAAAAKNDPTWKYAVNNTVFAVPGPNPNPAQAAATPSVPTGVVFPQDLRNCAVCHSPAKDAQGNVIAGAQADQWTSSPSRRTCQSCHDSSWFADTSPPKYHVMHQQATNPTAPPQGLVQTDDTQCKTCHSQTLLAQDHTAPNLSPAFSAITLKINSTKVSSVPVAVVAVNYTITNADGSPVADLKTLNSASANVSCMPAGSADYQIPSPPPVATANLITASTAAGDSGTYTVNVTLPATPSGTTWGTCAVGLEARRVNATLTTSERKLGHIGPTANFTEFAPVNPVAYFTFSGSGTATPRRAVVAQQNCNACHQVVTAHGSLRHTPEYCVLCHAPTATDRPGAGGTAGGGGTGRPPGTPGANADPAATIDKLTPAAGSGLGGSERSIHFKVLIHQIHTGENLETTQPFVVYGFGQSPNFFGDVRFPGNNSGTGAAACTKCHAPRGTTATYTVDAIPSNAAPTTSMQWTAATLDSSGNVTTGGTTTDVQPIAATCMACHDADDARSHAAQMTPNLLAPNGAPNALSAQGTESCGVCHGESAEFAVSKVHAKFTR